MLFGQRSVLRGRGCTYLGKYAVAHNGNSNLLSNRYLRGLWHALTTVALVVSSVVAIAGEAPRPKLAILPLEINDTSGEVGTSGERQERMLEALTNFLGERIGRTGLYDVIPQSRVAEAVRAVNSGTYLRSCNGCELDIGRRAGAEQVMIGWIWKVQHARPHAAHRDQGCCQRPHGLPARVRFSRRQREGLAARRRLHGRYAGARCRRIALKELRTVEFGRTTCVLHLTMRIVWAPQAAARH
jgi:hypothetical protein